MMMQVFRNVGMTQRRMVGGDWDPQGYHLKTVPLSNPSCHSNYLLYSSVEIVKMAIPSSIDNLVTSSRQGK